MTTIQSIAAFTILFAFGAPAFAADPAEILRQADAVRMPQEDFMVQVKVTSKRPDGHRKVGVYEVLVKGNDRTLIKTMAPPTDRGRSLLMLGRDLWAYLPNVSKPIRISLQQRLIGDVANGDLARANFTGDYTPTLASTDAQNYNLHLEAVDPSVTYHAIDLAVQKATFRPVKAKFYAASGRLLKICEYADFRSLAGRERPSRLVMKDAVVSGQQSEIEYREIILTPNLPAKYFTKDYLKKIKY